MQMSSACMPPIQPQASAAEQQHPRYVEYLAYRSALSRQLVTADSFARWLSATEEHERGKRVIFEVTSRGAKLSPGWYCNEFRPRRMEPITHGPFSSKEEADSV